MEFNVRLLSSCVILCACVAENEDTFSAVTVFPGLTSLYLRMKIREPHLDPNTEADVATKKRVCQSITRSVYFDLNYEENPIDMDQVREKLTRRIENEIVDLPPSKLLEEVLLDYEGGVFIYRTRLIRFSTAWGEREEFAFACATSNQNADESVNVYYISDSYNARKAFDVPSIVGRTGARFVCTIIASRCWLVALAEEPATAYPSPTYSLMYALQNIYLEMTTFYEMSESASDDPLCGLTKWEKLRVCASVLNAPYFTNRIEFDPDPYIFDGTCQVREVLFLSLSDEEMEERNNFFEWMLPCSVESFVDGTGQTAYLLSRAYQSHHVFVYARDPWTDEYFVEGVCGNVSAVIESDIRTTGERSGGETFPNLIDLLETKYSPIASSSRMEEGK